MPTPPTPPRSSPPASNIWKLNVYARVTDIAGNVTTTTADTYYFFIDQALDKPRVTVISPAAGTTNVAGPVDHLGHWPRRRRAAPRGDADRRQRRRRLRGLRGLLERLRQGRRRRHPGPLRARGRLVPRDRHQPVVAADQRLRRDVPDRGRAQRRHHRARARGGHQGRRPHGGHRRRHPGVHDPPRRHDPAHRKPQPASPATTSQGQFHITGQALDDEQIGTLQISYDGGINYQNLPGRPFTVNPLR